MSIPDTQYSEQIYNSAIEHGYDDCGIIPISDMDGYLERLNERINHVPKSKDFYSRYSKFTNPELSTNYPWAKSIIVCTSWYGKYIVPEKLKGYYGKFYLMDGRHDEQSKEWQERQRFEDELDKLGIRHYAEHSFGITGIRYAALQAGLGIIRKNNFFYTKKGSYVAIYAWLIDKKIVLKQHNEIHPCSESCNLCQKSCKTHSLSAPYTMNPFRCISFITTRSKNILPNDATEEDLGNWVYGCDDCQDACPYNKKAWTDDDIFPNLNDLENTLQPETLAVATDEILEKKVQPKLWYISKDHLSQYRNNAKRVLGISKSEDTE